MLFNTDVIIRCRYLASDFPIFKQDIELILAIIDFKLSIFHRKVDLNRIEGALNPGLK